MRRYRGMFALAEQEVLQACRHWRSQLLGPIAGWGVFMLTFAAALGSRIGPMANAGFGAFIIPGLCTMAMLTNTGLTTGTAVWQARHDRYINAVLSAPLRPADIALGYLIGSLFRPMVIGAGLLGVGPMMFDVPIRRPLVLVIAWVLTLTLVGAVGLIIGLHSRTAQQVTTAVIYGLQPLGYVSGVWFTTDVIPPPVRELMRLDPVFYVTQAIRAGMLGTADASVWQSLTITAGLVAALLTVALWLFTTGRGLKA